MDCPYDFEDISTASGSGSSGGSSRDYSSGYSDGYAKGESAGYSSGYADGKAEAEKTANARIKELKEEAEADVEEARKRATSDTWGLAILFGFPAVAIATGLVLTRSHNREMDGYTAEIANLKKELNDARNQQAIQEVCPGTKITDGIPADVTLNLTCTPVKGKTSVNRPYGDYTVYITQSGKKYHCKYQCCGAKTPAHLFRIPNGIAPCSNCVPISVRKEQVPDWYLQIVNPKQVQSLPSDPQIASVPKVEKVDSSFIKSISYRDGDLFVEMPGGTYCYYNVPESVYKEFQAAPSKGKYFHECIKDEYPYR